MGDGEDPVRLTLLAVVVVLAWLWKRGFFDHDEENEVSPRTRNKIFEASVRAAVKQEQELPMNRRGVIDVAQRRSPLSRVGIR
jgi:hypothetical protein